MKKTMTMTVLCFLMATGFLQASSTPDKLRIGIGALQGGNPEMPEYIRYFQLSKSNAEIQWASIEKTQGVFDFSVIEKKLAEVKAMNPNCHHQAQR